MFYSTTTPEQWYERIFGSEISVADYFNEVSEGFLTLEPADETSGTINDGIVGWYQTGQTLSSYMSQCQEPTKYQLCDDLIREAIILADQHVTFPRFDNRDPSNHLSSDELHIIIVAAGYDGSEKFSDIPSNKRSFWRHRWYMSTDLPPPGIFLFSKNNDGGYIAIGEKAFGLFESDPLPLGFIAHEMGHDLGFPDLYDNTKVSHGIGDFGLMGKGDVLGLAESPAYPSAYNRLEAEWLTESNGKLRIVSGMLNNVNILAASSPDPGIKAYKLPTSNNDEYFLIENRKELTDYDDLPGHGLLIWHIDKSNGKLPYPNNDVYNKRVDLEEADGNNELDNSNKNSGDIYDFWYSNNKYIDFSPPAFNSSSNPSSLMNNDKSDSGAIVKEISKRNNLMNATFITHFSGPVGETFETKSFTIDNIGDADLKIRAMEPTKSWINISISVTDLPITLSPSESPLDVGVTVSSAACSRSETKNGAIHIESNDKDMDYPITLNCDEMETAETSSGAASIIYNFTQPGIILSDYIRIPKNATIRYASMKIREVY